MQPKSLLPPTARVGLTVLAGVLLIYLLITWVKRSHLFAPEENLYTIYFENVSGLLKGDPVQLRGYTVGRVEEIVPSAKYVSVVAAVDASIPIYEDAKAEIQVKELMGGKQVALFPGNSGKMLTGKDIIITGDASLDFSSSFSEVGELLNVLENQQLATTANRLDSITKWMHVMLQNINPKTPGRIFAQTEKVTNELERLSVLSKKTNWKAEIQRYKNTLDETLDHAYQFMEKADSMLAELDIRQLNEDLQKGTSLMERADSLLGSVETILASFDDQEVLAGRLLHDKGLSKGLDTTLYHLNQTLKQIHEQKVIVVLAEKRKNDLKLAKNIRASVAPF